MARFPAKIFPIISRQQSIGQVSKRYVNWQERHNSRGRRGRLQKTREKGNCERFLFPHVPHSPLTFPDSPSPSPFSTCHAGYKCPKNLKTVTICYKVSVVRRICQPRMGANTGRLCQTKMYHPLLKQRNDANSHFHSFLFSFALQSFLTWM